jgi:hypothetical protein
MPALQLHIGWKGKNVHTLIQDWIYGFAITIVPSAVQPCIYMFIQLTLSLDSIINFLFWICNRLTAPYVSLM